MDFYKHLNPENNSAVLVDVIRELAEEIELQNRVIEELMEKWKPKNVTEA